MKRVLALGAVALAAALVLGGCAARAHGSSGLTPAHRSTVTTTVPRATTPGATTTAPTSAGTTAPLTGVDATLTGLDATLAGIDSQITAADRANDDDN